MAEKRAPANGKGQIDAPPSPKKTEAASLASESLKPLRLGKDCDYDQELRRLQIELVKLHEWIRHQGLKVVILFEGRDAAGKGGAIQRISQTLNPRICRVVALGHADRAGENPMVFPALCRAPAGGRRDGAVRPQLV